MFNSKWITAKEFNLLNPIDIYHKEHDKKTLPETPDELKNSRCRFKKIFLAKTGSNYKIKISADDYYKLYINGNFVCQGPAPAYEDSYYYNEADVTGFVSDGENLMEVEVYYQGCNNRVWNSADNRQGLIADVFENGEYILGTDDTWQYTYIKEYYGSPVIGYKTQYIENIDFNKAERCYENAVINEKDEHKFSKCVPTVSVYTLKPESVKKCGKAHYIIDMGKEYTGQLRFALKGEKNEKVILRHGEELNDDGSVKFEMRCNCCYEEVLTLSGERDETDFYDYKAFRYAEIIAETDSLIEESLEMIVRHHRFNEDGFSIKCSEPLVEDIWEICAQALKIAVQEGYLDCPSREKGQYLGDFLVSGLAHMYLTGDSEMYKKTLLEFALSTKVSKGIMAVAPGSFMQEIADFSLLYPKTVLNYLKYTNDVIFVKELLPVLDGLLEYFKGYENERGLLEGVVEKWNLVDWPDNLRDNYDFELKNPPKAEGCHNVINAYYYCAHKTVEDIKKAVGVECEGYSEKVKEAYIAEFYKEDMKLFTDTKESDHTSLHSNALPACFGIAPDEAKDEIKKLIMEKGLCCGVWFSYFVLKALAKIGAYKEEYELITNKSEHSWYNMLKEGATTCFEAWGKEQKWNTSLCHPWASSAIIAVIEDIAGIKGESFYGDELIAESHVPEGLKLEIKLPKKGSGLMFKGE